MSAFNVRKHAFARERLTVADSVVTLTPATYNNSGAAAAVREKANSARISVEAQPLRFTEDGTAPVGSTGPGALAAAGDVLYLDSYEAIVKFKAIRDTGSSSAIEVVYYR